MVHFKASRVMDLGAAKRPPSSARKSLRCSASNWGRLRQHHCRQRREPRHRRSQLASPAVEAGTGRGV